ncbi:hypothetical protein HDZ31DRAFT_67737 [Schizophyllum fasciatum]
MPSQSGHYDEGLLAEAPKATKAQLQEGYNPDILAPQRPATTSPTRDIESKGQSPATTPALYTPSARRPPFWRTKKGMIALAVLALVIVGAVVGGAVGGTVGKSDGKSGGEGGLTTPSATATVVTSTDGEGQVVTSTVAGGGDGGQGQAAATTTSAEGGQGQATAAATTTTNSGGQQGQGANNGASNADSGDVAVVAVGDAERRR